MLSTEPGDSIFNDTETTSANLLDNNGAFTVDGNTSIYWYKY